jgi:hypothetical protein
MAANPTADRRGIDGDVGERADLLLAALIEAALVVGRSDDPGRPARPGLINGHVLDGLVREVTPPEAEALTTLSISKNPRG